jgi:hypothetical protein
MQRHLKNVGVELGVKQVVLSSDAEGQSERSTLHGILRYAGSLRDRLPLRRPET